MKIIINQDVPNLGEEGDVCEVANGYARNFLFPKKLAVPYNKHYLTIFKQKQKAIEKRKEGKRLEAKGLKQRIEEESLVFELQAGENGKLFGSITNSHIADELAKKGLSIERKRIEIPEHHIKNVGEYKIRIKLDGDEDANLPVSVKAVEKK